MESKCPHCGKLPSEKIEPITWIGTSKNISNITVSPFDFNSLYLFQGCSSQGFCYNCNIFYWDSTCFCMGTTCYKCGQKVIGKYSSPPKDLPDGVYEYRCWNKTEMREFKNGVLGKTVEGSKKELSRV